MHDALWCARKKRIGVSEYVTARAAQRLKHSPVRATARCGSIARWGGYAYNTAIKRLFHATVLRGRPDVTHEYQFIRAGLVIFALDKSQSISVARNLQPGMLPCMFSQT